MTENGNELKNGIILIGKPEVRQLHIVIDLGAFRKADMGLAYSQVRQGRY